MDKKEFKKYHFYVWLGNLVIFLFLIGFLIASQKNTTLHNIFLSEEFSQKYFGFLGFEEPLVLTIIGLAMLWVAANIIVFYQDRYSYEKNSGILKENEEKRKIFNKKAYCFFIFITLLNLFFEIYLIYTSLFLGKFQSQFFEVIMIIGFLFLPINIAITIGFRSSRK